MKAIVVTDQAAGTAGMKLMERPKPQDGRALVLSRDSTVSIPRYVGGPSAAHRQNHNVRKFLTSPHNLSVVDPAGV